MIIDFIEPKKVKDILEQVDDSLTDVGLAKLIEKLIYRYDRLGYYFYMILVLLVVAIVVMSAPMFFLIPR